MLSGRGNTRHFSAKYSAISVVQLCIHCRTLSTISQTWEAASKSWRALSRLTHPPIKKAPVSLPVPISPPFAAFCVSSVFASYRYPPINPDKLNTRQAVEMKIATSITENERPTTTQRILASFMMLSDIFTPTPLTISQQWSILPSHTESEIQRYRQPPT